MYHSQPPPASEGTSLLPSCLSRFPQLGLEGRAGEERGLFSQRLDMPSSFDSNHSKVHESLLLLKSILDVSISARSQRCDFSFCRLMSDPMAQSFDLTQPITIPSHALVHFLQSSYLCSSLKWGEEASQ